MASTTRAVKVPNWAPTAACIGVGTLVAIFIVTAPSYLNYDHHYKELSVKGDKTETGPFYRSPESNSFYKTATAEQPITDKVTTHSYEFMYEKYLATRRHHKLKLLEIGLGCDMAYGPGASATVWRKYLPHAELWFAEFNADCVALHMSQLNALSVKAVTGDQADVETLKRWVNETQGGFDVIVDDGGHQNQQILASFTVLFHNALKAGGVYFIEDLHVSREWPGTGPIVLDVLHDWQESLLTKRIYDANGDHIPPTDIKSIECVAEACIITKCTSDDTTCPFLRF
jgi:hypothetical protein